MENIIPGRTPEVIAAEINTIQYQTKQIALVGAIEIGRRLKEVKEMLPHGEWGRWLEDSCSYSQRTAEKLIRLFKGYGCQQPLFQAFETQAPEHALPDLNCTQAFLLLGVPEADREQFIAELDINNMSTRELQKAVSERNQAIKERDEALRETADFQKTIDDQASRLTRLSTEREELKKKAEKAKKSEKEIEEEARKLKIEMDTLKGSLEYKERETLKGKLQATRTKESANRIVYLSESLDKTFKELTWELDQFAGKDQEAHEMYKDKILHFLSRGMATVTKSGLKKRGES